MRDSVPLLTQAKFTQVQVLLPPSRKKGEKMNEKEVLFLQLWNRIGEEL